MLDRLLAANAAVCVLALLGFAGQADATTRLTLKASPSLIILAQENSEVQNLLDPQSDNGTILKSTLGVASLNMGSVVLGDANVRPCGRDRKRLDPRLYRLVSHGRSTGIEVTKALRRKLDHGDGRVFGDPEPFLSEKLAISVWVHLAEFGNSTHARKAAGFINPNLSPSVPCPSNARQRHRLLS